MNKLRNTSDMESYEEKYKQAIEAAKRELHYCGSLDCDAARQIFRLFPELKESEDEKIIRTLKEIVNWGCAKNISVENNVELKDCLAWLEKQGERKTEIEYIYPKFRIGDVIEPIKPNGSYMPVRVLSIEKTTKSYYCESDDKKHFSSIPIRCEDEYKLVEQKPDKLEFAKQWYNDSTTTAKEKLFLEQIFPELKESEDEKILNILMKIIGEFSREKNHHWFFDEVDSKTITDWLKSLKHQYHWKPEGQQLDCLRHMLNVSTVDKIDKQIIQDLYEQLKSL